MHSVRADRNAVALSSTCLHPSPTAAHAPGPTLPPPPGVIGRRLKMDAFIPAIPELIPTLGASAEDAHRSAIAITTTGEP